MRIRFKVAAKVLLTVFVVAIMLEVWTVNRLSSYGSKINQLKTAQATIALQNQILENQIAASASLHGVESKVTALGFGDIKNTLYIQPQTIASAF